MGFPDYTYPKKKKMEARYAHFKSGVAGTVGGQFRGDNRRRILDMNCSNQELMGWVVGTMAAVLSAGAFLYWGSSIPCGGGLWIAFGLVSAALTMTLAGMRPAFTRYRTCWGDGNPDAKCKVSFNTINNMITAVAGVLGAAILALLVGAAAATTECATIPLFGVFVSIATSIPIGAITAATLFGSIALFGSLIWAVATIQSCLSQNQ